MKNQTIKNEKRTIAINKVIKECKLNKFNADETAQIIEGFISELDYIEICLQRENMTAGLSAELNQIINEDITLHFREVIKGYNDDILESLNLSIIFSLIEFVNDLLNITNDTVMITKLNKFKDLLYVYIID